MFCNQLNLFNLKSDCLLAEVIGRCTQSEGVQATSISHTPNMASELPKLVKTI